MHAREEETWPQKRKNLRLSRFGTVTIANAPQQASRVIEPSVKVTFSTIGIGLPQSAPQKVNYPLFPVIDFF
jgi:hypothetical protein